MKTMKFKEFINEIFKADLSLTQEERKYLSDVIKNGDLFVSKDADFNLGGIEIKIFDYSGHVSEEDVNQRVKDQIATSILSGKNFGIVNDEPYNKEWQIEI